MQLLIKLNEALLVPVRWKLNKMHNKTHHLIPYGVHASQSFNDNYNLNHESKYTVP